MVGLHRNLVMPTKLNSKIWTIIYIIAHYYEIIHIVQWLDYVAAISHIRWAQKVFGQRKYFLKRILFLKSKRYPVRNESSNWCRMNIDMMISALL